MIACFLSHRKAWQHIVDQNYKSGLIFEDDAQIDHRQFSQALKTANSQLRDNLIIQFKLKTPSATERKLGLYNHIYAPIVAPLGLVGYLISQQAAKQLLLLTKKIDRPVDDFLRLTKLTRIYSGEIYPSGIKTIDAELGGSTIGNQNMKKQDLSFLAKLSREIKRVIYQARLIV